MNIRAEDVAVANSVLWKWDGGGGVEPKRERATLT